MTNPEEPTVVQTLSTEHLCRIAESALGWIRTGPGAPAFVDVTTLELLVAELRRRAEMDLA